MSFRLELLGEEPALPSQLRGLGTARPLVDATLGTVFNNPDYELPFFPAILEDPEWQSHITELRDAWHALPGPAAAAALVEQISRSIDQ